MVGDGPRGSRELRHFLTITFGFTWSLWWTSAWLSQAYEWFPTLPLTLLGGFGPALAAVILTRRAGRGAWQDFLHRAVRARGLPPGWWVAILAVAVGPMLIAKLLPVSDTAIIAIGASGVVAVLVGVVVPSIGEELGWRGFALDRLQARWSPITASLVLGAIWALWHTPLFFVVGWWYAEVGLRLAPVLLLWLLAWSLVHTAAYGLSHRSILVAVLLHAASNMAWALFEPTLGEFTVATALVGVVAAVAAGTVLRHRPTGAHVDREALTPLGAR